MASTRTFSHPSIGHIKALSSKEGVLQFLGLQYATLSDRFARAVMKEYSKDETIDATKLGPQVLSIAPGPEPEFGLLQHTLEYDRSAFTMSETEGLCLNITVPASTTPESSLPVFAFIHGGGFNVGSAMYPQHDMARFVRLSEQEGKPCIAVALNYRTGPPGLLTSHSLRAAGYKPNNTLHDQRTALLWLQRHISGFGGDAANVTLMGESAGGVSVCYHLFSEEALFKRMMVMSGTNLLMPPVTEKNAGEGWEGAMHALGLRGLGGEEQVKALRGMEAMEMVRKLTQAGTSFTPVLDNDLCPTHFTFASMRDGTTDLPGKQWCEAAVIGDCQFDGSIQALRLAGREKDIGSNFCTSIRSNLPDEVASDLLAAYNLHPNLDDEEGLLRVLQVANDLNFYIPTLALAESLGDDVKKYLYRFNTPNPWPGRWKGYATHILDLAFLLQNFNEFLDETQRALAEGFARDVIAFVNGGEPWKEWRDGDRVAKVLGPVERSEVVADVAERVGRRGVMLQLGEKVGLDRLSDAFSAFMKGTPLPN